MLCHYPDPFNILAIKAGFSDERNETKYKTSSPLGRGEGGKGQKTNNYYYYYCTLLVGKCGSRAVSSNGEVFILREYGYLWKGFSL